MFVCGEGGYVFVYAEFQAAILNLDLKLALGGWKEACVTKGPQQKLLCPNETMAHLPLRLPHRSLAAQERLSLPADGKDHLERTPFASRTNEVKYASMRQMHIC